MSESPLEWWFERQFLKMAEVCRLAVRASDLQRIGKEGLLPTPTYDGQPVYCRLHLGLLWLYKRAAVSWHNPWSAESGDMARRMVELEGLRQRVSPFVAWMGGAGFNAEEWGGLHREFRTHNVLGHAAAIQQLLEPSILATVQGEPRLFLELERFFEALWAFVREEGAEGSAFPTVKHLLALFGPEEEEPTEEPNPLAIPYARLAAPTGDQGGFVRFGFERQASPVVTEQPLLTASELARQHARKAVTETSALFALGPASRPETTGRMRRLDHFEIEEARLEADEDWTGLAAHYRTSLDLFSKDIDVGRVLHLLGNLMLERLAQPEEAINLYLRALERTPADGASLDRVAPLLRDASRHAELAHLWQRAATHSAAGFASRCWTQVAEILLSDIGDLTEAIRALRFAIEADSTNAPAHKTLSQLVALQHGASPADSQEDGLNLAEMAERWATRQTDSHQASAWYVRAAVLFLQHEGDVDRAFTCLEQALTLDPERESAVTRLEALARHRDRWEDFVVVVERLIARGRAAGDMRLYRRLQEVFRRRLQEAKVEDHLIERISGLFPVASPDDGSGG